MRLLLDTHTFLWSILDTGQLSRNVVSAVSDRNNDVFVSSVSLWEISIKFGIGKLQLSNLVPDDFVELAARSEFTLVSPEFQVTASSHQLPVVPNHRDPFDRMLIWMAIQEDFTLVSKDRNFKQYKNLGLKILW
ncbi:MAG: type II toxin-antitoxin system VapC family toxin [Cyclobacteriaceae bacterium]|jgi:PIN domain nuclease of toxin-antitoxin system